jgi:RNA polymerase sigma-70 factor (ECF subfamily)
MDPAMALPNTEAVAADTWDFTALVRQHQAMVFSVAFHFLGNRALAEELAQDVMVELYRHYRKLESPEHVVFWLRRVTANRCIDQARKRSREPEIPLEEAPEPVAPAAEPDPMLSAHVRRLVASLPEKARAIVLLRYQEDLGPEEIASVLRIPVNTVKSQLHRALATLREKAERLEWEE